MMIYTYMCQRLNVTILRFFSNHNFYEDDNNCYSYMFYDREKIDGTLRSVTSHTSNKLQLPKGQIRLGKQYKRFLCKALLRLKSETLS